MNMKFELGKVSVPMGSQKVEVEGIKVHVEDLSLLEYIEVMAKTPGILRELKSVMESETEESPQHPLESLFSMKSSPMGGAPSAISPFGIQSLGGSPLGGNPFGGNPFSSGAIAVPKGHPLADLLNHLQNKEEGEGL